MKRIIVLEGPDSIGKTTQAKLLAEHYRATPVVQPSGDGPLGFLRYWVKQQSRKFTPFEIQCLHTISHLGDIPTKFHKKNGNESFLMDRSHISTWVYGQVTGLTEEQNSLLLEIHKSMYWSVVDQRYDITIAFLDRDKRISRDEDDEFEKSLKWEDLKSRYREIYDKALTDPDTWFFHPKEKIIRVDVADKTIEQTRDELIEKIGE